MRPLSIAQIKKGHDTRHALPKEGSKTRDFYDKITSGQVVSRRDYKYFATIKSNLETFYGLEIVPSGAGYWRMR